MAPARDVKRGSRRRQDIPTVAVVGYTNAGKSSIINRLTGSQELVEMHCLQLLILQYVVLKLKMVEAILW